MNNSPWKEEVTRFLALSAGDQQKWLARLLFSLTICARDTYTVGQDGLDDPERMRRFNELMHRTAGQLRQHLEGLTGRPDEVFLRILEEALAELGVDINHVPAMLG